MAIEIVMAIITGMTGNIVGASTIDTRDLSDFRSKKIEAPLGDLENMMNPLTSTSLIV